MRTDSVSYEVFEEEKPSYLPSYIMSGFVLVALVSLAHNRVPLWPLSIVHLVLAFWFGTLFMWMLQNARERKMLSSHRLTITSDTFRHSFRYAVAEATHVEIPISQIEEVRISPEEPRSIEVIGKPDGDLYFLPQTADLEQLIVALQTVNPLIRVTLTNR